MRASARMYRSLNSAGGWDARTGRIQSTERNNCGKYAYCRRVPTPWRGGVKVGWSCGQLVVPFYQTRRLAAKVVKRGSRDGEYGLFKGHLELRVVGCFM